MCDEREEGSRKFIVYYSTKLTAQNKIIFNASNYLFSEWKDKQNCVGFRSMHFT
jgi:hypothetical protein